MDLALTCSRCGDPRSRYSHKWCNACFNTARNTRWRARKIELADRKGGECSICGWRPTSSREYAALDFHHRDPSQKSFAISGNHVLRKAADAEAEKCDLVCANCHRIHHARDW